MLLTIKIAQALVDKVTESAAVTGVSPNEYVTLAISEKLARDEHQAWRRKQDQKKK